MKKSMMISIMIAFLGIILIITGSYSILTQEKQIKIYQEAISSCNNLYNANHFPKDELTIKEINTCKSKIKKISNNTEQKKLKIQTQQTEDYLNLKLEINSYLENGIIKENVTQETIDDLQKKLKLLKEEYQLPLNSQVESIKYQLNIIEIATLAVNSTFKDSKKQAVIDNINIEVYNNALQTVNQISNFKLKSSYLNDLSKVELVLNAKDGQVGKQPEVVNLAQEEERRKSQEAINNAWVKLNVPYISQNKNRVLNGCEAAALLMGLQYKGYLKGMDIRTFATNMPKSNDPNTGFYLDIFDLYPLNVSHWIAPAPLAKYGVASSGNTKIIDGTGMSIEEIDNEILKGNPVIIYLTSRFKAPKNWSNGVPSNLHVQLLTGYNTITGEHLITDPWTENNGSYQWILEKKTIENIYNALGKRAVVIR